MQTKLTTKGEDTIDISAVEHVIGEKKTSNREAAIIQHAFTKSVWTRVDLLKQGYEVDSALSPSALPPQTH